MPNKLQVQYSYTMRLSDKGKELSSCYTVRIFDDFNKIDYGAYDTFKEMAEEVHRSNIFKIITHYVCSSYGFLNVVKRHNGLYFIDEWVPYSKEINKGIYKFQGVVFDDFVSEGIESSTKSFPATWSYVCQHCVDVHAFDNSLLSKDCAEGMCGVQGCSNEAVHYIDFPSRTFAVNEQ